MNLTETLNRVKDPATRKALEEIFATLKADMDANKTAFDGHDHGGAADATPVDSGDAASTFSQNLN